MSAPDMGSMMVTDAMNPPETTTSDVPNQIPEPAPQTMPDPAQQTPAPSAPAPNTPPKPSLWKGVLMGALQGLAAGGAVNTKGMSSGSAFAAGLGAGANQVLNVNPQQKAELDQTKAATAIHYANLAKIQRDIHLMPDSKQEAYLRDAAEQSSTMMKSGAITPVSQPSDLIPAQQQLQQLHAQNPWAVYSVMPVLGPDGNMQYSAVQFSKAPIQTDLTLKGPDGKDITIPAGTSGEDVGKLFTSITAKKLDAESKQTIAAGNQKTRVGVQQLKNQGAVDVQNLKNQGAADKAASKPADMVFGTSQDGRQVAGSPAELQAAGIQNPVKLPGTEAQKVVVARQLIGPRKGLFDMVNNDINNLAQQGKLGVVASRWGEFMAGKVGDDPDFQPLRTHMGLLSTALMQAHVGARGSKEMLQHFRDLANYSISNEATLRKAIGAEWDYVNEKAMLPAGNPVAGRTGPGQTTPTAGSNPQPIYASAPGKPRMQSVDGGKTWQPAQ